MTKLLVSFIVVILTSFFLFQSVFAVEWFKNPYFIDPAIEFDTGIVYNQIVSESPDDWKWRYESFTWKENEPEGPTTRCQIKSYNAGTNNYDVYMYGSYFESDCDLEIQFPYLDCRMGVVTLKQGNVWGPNAPWHLPLPLSISIKKIYVDTWLHDVNHEGSHIMYAMNVWLKDESTDKKMVLDLIFFLSSSWNHQHFVDDNGRFHYQAIVNDINGNSCWICNPWEIPCPWRRCNFDLSDYIDDAISQAASYGVNFNRDQMKIYQAEMLIELFWAHGALEVGSLRMYTDPCYSDSDCYTGYVCDLTYNECVSCDSNHVETGGYSPNNECESACDAVPNCDEKRPGESWCGPNDILKKCDSNCQFTEINCKEEYGSNYMCSYSKCRAGGGGGGDGWRRPRMLGLTEGDIMIIIVTVMLIVIVVSVFKLGMKRIWD